jgi:hypothetical protein
MRASAECHSARLCSTSTCLHWLENYIACYATHAHTNILMWTICVNVKHSKIDKKVMMSYINRQEEVVGHRAGYCKLASCLCAAYSYSFSMVLSGIKVQSLSALHVWSKTLHMRWAGWIRQLTVLCSKHFASEVSEVRRTASTSICVKGCEWVLVLCQEHWLVTHLRRDTWMNRRWHRCLL